jgi:hypothetical protein
LDPSATNRSVVALPTPPPAPVTIATLPLRLISGKEQGLFLKYSVINIGQKWSFDAYISS